MENKTKATATLATSALLAVSTLPEISPLKFILTGGAGGFVLGLLNHGFLAATIGGMADWFGVTALFRKPLGIGFHTEILRRNRGRIMDAIVEFVGTDLLNTKNIMETVHDENTAQLLIDYFEQNKGRAKTKALVREILTELFGGLDTQKISKDVAPIIEREIKNLDAQKLFDAVVKVVTNDKHSRKILITLFDTGHKILRSPHMQEEILKKITELRTAYEGDSAGRALVLSSMDLTDEKILNILNETVEKKISDAEKVLNTTGALVDSETAAAADEMIKMFGGFVTNAAGNLNTKKFFDDLLKLFLQKFDTANFIKTWLDVNVKGETDPKILEKLRRQQAANPKTTRIVEVERKPVIWKEAVDYIVDAKIDEFIKDDALQKSFDKLIKDFIENLLDEYREQIPTMIRERLDKFSDDELTEFVEGHVADDLQMIRINGSICGGLVGMFLFVVSKIIERIAYG
ncbi:MAG: DUF445 domain-containing protein [Selenomonadaceae bacterium]|nr:DUF445 domain-containing protein [Selenomonadaceae bacterium]MBQ9497978.1 DUF445 domain-containing protein [Selenomonadaceae bacterium]